MIRVTCDRCGAKMAEDNQYCVNDKWAGLCDRCEKEHYEVLRVIEAYSQIKLKSFMEGK